MKRILLLTSLILCFSCVDNKSPLDKKMSEKEIKQLIEINKDKKLFLSFWSGMTDDEFTNIKEYENKSGNLKNDKFIIHPNEFEVTKDYDSKKINLIYNEIDDKPYHLNQEATIKYYEENFIDEVIEVFDEKYQRLDKENYKQTLKQRMNFPVKKEKKYRKGEIIMPLKGLNPVFNYKDLYVYFTKNITWTDNNRAINIDYEINGHLERSINFHLIISYMLFDDFKKEVESELIEEKKVIEKWNNEIEQTDKEVEKTKDLL